MARDRYVPTYDVPPLPPAGLPTYPPGPTSPEPPPRAPPPGGVPPICGPGETQGCRPPPEQTPSVPSIPAEQQRAVEAAIAANFPKPKGKVRRENVPRKVAKRNLDAFRLGVVNPAAQMVLDAIRATGQQIAEEGLKVLFGKIFKVGKIAKGGAIVVRMAQEMRKAPKKPGPDFKQLREELAYLRDRMAGYGFPVPKQPTKVTPKPSPPPRKPTKSEKIIPLAYPRPSPLFSGPVTVPGAQSVPRPAPAPAKPAARPVAAPARPVAAPARPGAPLPGQLQPVKVTGRRVGQGAPISKARPATSSPTRTATRTPTSTAPKTRTTTTSRTQPLARLLSSLPAPAQFLRPSTRAPSPRPVQSTRDLTSLQQRVLTLTQTVPAMQTRTKQKTCECKEQRKERKKRPPRTVCYRGTYTETARGLIKTRKERIECPQSKSK